MKIVLEPYGKMPTKAHSQDAGYDIYAPKDIHIHPYERIRILTGVHMQIPEGYHGRIANRSSMYLSGLETDGTVDCGYTGEIVLTMFNTDTVTKTIFAGNRIAQIIVIPQLSEPLELVDALDETERGDGGFGSSGK